MADIVERLRAPANQFLLDPRVAKEGTLLLSDAADEVERLREIRVALLSALHTLNEDPAGPGYCFCPFNQDSSMPEEDHHADCQAARAAIAKAEAYGEAASVED